jgi:hypothetical protein
LFAWFLKMMKARRMVLRRFASSSASNAVLSGIEADLPASDHVLPGSSYINAIQAFTNYKLRGDRLGYAWRVEEKAMTQELQLHHAQVR